MNTKIQKSRIENGFENGKHQSLRNGGEAVETDLPRIVITADDVVMLPTAGKTLSLSREEIDCIVRLNQALRRNVE